MKKEEIDKLWEMYREFCNRANQANMTPYAAEFLAYLERFKLTPSENV